MRHPQFGSPRHPHCLIGEERRCPFFDLSLTELERYLPERREPADFDDFWQRTLASFRSVDRAVDALPYAAHLPFVDVLDVSFAGFGGQRVHGWWIRPAGDLPAGGWPVVVESLG